MQPINIEIVANYIAENIGSFHKKRLSSLDTLNLEKVLQRKNPYLFKAKHLLTAEQIVRGIVDAHISSNEETIFGDWLEGLAIFINQSVYNGKKSGILGIDLEFDKDNVRYIVSIKSGPNWANSSQLKKLISDFKAAKKTLRTSKSNLNVVAILGCCYGRDNKPDKGDYFRFCGQRFWEFTSGNENLFIEMIEPLGHKAKDKNDEFQTLYVQVINVLTRQFAIEFCNEHGSIDWEKIVQINSAIAKPSKMKQASLRGVSANLKA